MQSLSIDKTYWCFNHLGEENLQKLANIAGIEIYGILSPCKSYILTKIVKTIICTSTTQATYIMDLFYNNLVGLIIPIKYNKALYFQMITNNCFCVG